jgi:hypothetical protein
VEIKGGKYSKNVTFLNSFLLFTYKILVDSWYESVTMLVSDIIEVVIVPITLAKHIEYLLYVKLYNTLHLH